MGEGDLWTWLVILSSAAGAMTLLVRVAAIGERWVVSSWVVVYLGSALLLGVLWVLMRR
jgi:hypothetical protein